MQPIEQQLREACAAYADTSLPRGGSLTMLSAQRSASSRAAVGEPGTGFPAALAGDVAAGTVLVAGFEGLLADGLRALLARERTLRVVGAAAEHDEAAALERYRPACALLRYEALDGAADVRRLALAFSRTSLIVLCVHATSGQLNHLRAAGAAAAISIGIAGRDLIDVLRCIGHTGLPPAPMSTHLAGLPSCLTGRETQVLELLEHDRSLTEVAALLKIGLETVRTHARQVYRKLGVRGRRELTGLPQAARNTAPRSPMAGVVSLPFRRRSSSGFRGAWLPGPGDPDNGADRRHRARC